ncbi:hypothetical protein P5815_30225 [Bacillus cereus]|uniref:hypothetical protein n=1 Tax=Bacillus cereus TaxID=1396 RepID=UPI000BF73AB5|nr:hypothetical protein [Bacillus cereus]MCU5065071.1 hypothetical protein [Bacillus cereus]MDF9524776.1 hypothetical protein [Bacillus cereus]MDF9564455.1 hypothetical protein [Bacillus cereus]PFJ73275.1 hypothetical protein COJ08_26185 [Bacillus cereus]PGR00808.1 hypothetical protein COA24_13010 [Bacillus cereus]
MNNSKLDKFKNLNMGENADPNPNPYANAVTEVEKNEKVTAPNMPAMDIPKGKEKKEQMSLMFTRTHKQKARRISKKHGMSVSELFGYWLDQYEE